jgi:hypothetical protein
VSVPEEVIQVNPAGVRVRKYQNRRTAAITTVTVAVIQNLPATSATPRYRGTDISKEAAVSLKESLVGAVTKARKVGTAEESNLLKSNEPYLKSAFPATRKVDLFFNAGNRSVNIVIHSLRGVTGTRHIHSIFTRCNYSQHFITNK